MNLGRLRIFDEVARRGTFSAAAAALSYSPSAVSQQMAKLEAELATVLVVRTPQGVLLTDAGRLLLDRTEAILSEVRAAHAELDALAGLRAGTVRLGSFPAATQTVVARALGVFGERFPAVEVVLVDDGTAGANLDRMRLGELDVAVVVGEGCEDGLQLRPLLDEGFVVVVPEGDGLATDPCLAGLRDVTVIGRPDAPGIDALAAACREHGFELRLNGFVCPDPHAMRALVAAGEGVAVVPGLAATLQLEPTVAVRLVDWAPSRPVAVVRPSGPATPAAAAMEAVLVEVAAAFASRIPSWA